MDAKEFIDIMCPEHDRTSCSDEATDNGFFSRNGSTWHGRCRRCMWLEVLQDGKVPDGFDISDCAG